VTHGTNATPEVISGLTISSSQFDAPKQSTENGTLPSFNSISSSLSPHIASHTSESTSLVSTNSVLHTTPAASIPDVISNIHRAYPESTHHMTIISKNGIFQPKSFHVYGSFCTAEPASVAHVLSDPC
ncbi:hypothetical protein PanWU01x14_167160, partial [Parasponia andersonii]